MPRFLIGHIEMKSISGVGKMIKRINIDQALRTVPGFTQLCLSLYYYGTHQTLHEYIIVFAFTL